MFSQLWFFRPRHKARLAQFAIPRGKFRACRNARLTLESLEERTLLSAVSPVASGAGLFNSYPQNLTDVNGTLYFTTFAGGVEYDLWKTDGTATGTTLLEKFYPDGGQQPRSLTAVNGKLFFVVDADPHTLGPELWVSDGTSAGTHLVKDIYPGSRGSYPSNLTDLNGTLYFTAVDPNGLELWKSDGTAAGTVSVFDFGAYSGQAPPFTAAVSGNGKLFLAANAYVWVSDGTAAGTHLVFADQSPNYPTISGLMQVGGTVFFVTSDNLQNPTLWKSDGTVAGTVKVAALFPKTGTLDVPSAVDAQGDLLFLVSDYSSMGASLELWKSDGTAAATGMVQTLPYGGDTPFMITVGDTVFFMAGSALDQLWTTDGTPGGANELASIGPSQDAVALNGELYFTTTTGANGPALWQSDGTAAGTHPVLGAGASPVTHVEDLTVSNGKLFFTATNAALGNQLWESDGTAAGTTVAADVYNPLSVTATSFQATAGQLATVGVATFTAVGSGALPADFTATINWGDGQTTAGTIAANISGFFTVTGTHVYAQAGTFPTTVTVVELGTTAFSALGQAYVASYTPEAGAPFYVNRTFFDATAGQAFTVSVATLKSTSSAALAADYSATIDWGDGQTSTGIVAGNPGGGFSITGTHTYAQAGTFAPLVTITQVGGRIATAIDKVVVADLPAQAPPPPSSSSFYVNRTFFRATAGQALTTNVATFTSANPAAQAADFTAAINWGDGQSSAGTISANPSGGFSVTGTHTYANPGNYSPVVTITEPGGRAVTVTDITTVGSLPVISPLLSAHDTEAILGPSPWA